VIILSLIKTQGIVLRHNNLGESDKIITIFSDKLGKIDVVVHGAKSHKSKFMAASQPFCYGEYVLYKGKSLYTLSESNIIESFQAILSDFDKLLYGSYILELVNHLAEKDVKNVSLLALLLKTLYIMTHDEVNIEIIMLVFEFKAISISGYLPQVKYCLNCKNELSEGYFNIENGGINCNSCGKTNSKDYKIDEIILKYFQIIKNIKLEDLKKLNLDNEKVEYIKIIMKNYIMYHCDKKFNSLDIIDKLNKNRR
jgi:DNA repair protein RecO (recombination protein O)